MLTFLILHLQETHAPVQNQILHLMLVVHFVSVIQGIGKALLLHAHYVQLLVANALLQQQLVQLVMQDII